MALSLFEIDTRGTCLFCLNQNCVPLERNKIDLTTATALKMLFRYLELDITKLAHISSCGTLLLDASTNLAVSLCDTCFTLIDEFFELFQNFESIRFLLEACTWKLYQFIGQGTTDGERATEYRRRVQINSTRDELHSRFVEKLRVETSEKCFGKHSSSLPKIRLRRDVMNMPGRGSEMPNTMATEPGIGEGTNIDPHPVKIEVDDVQLTQNTAFAHETIVFPSSSIEVQGVQSNQTTKRKQVMLTRGSEEEPECGGIIEEAHCETQEVTEIQAHQQRNPRPRASKYVRSKKSKFSCDICGKRFLHAQYVRLHINKVHTDGVSKCDLCGKIFSLKLNLERHLQQVHHFQTPSDNSNSSSSFSCDYCDKVYPGKRCLQRHLQTQHSMQLYASRIPAHISEQVFESALDGLVEKILPVDEDGNHGNNKALLKSPCVLCGKALLCTKTTLRYHIVRYHFEKVIESAEEGIATAEGGGDNTISSFIPCKSEYPIPIPFQVDEEEGRSGFAFEAGGEHSLAEEVDPLGI